MKLNLICKMFTVFFVNNLTRNHFKTIFIVLFIFFFNFKFPDLLKRYPEPWTSEYRNESMTSSISKSSGGPFLLELLKEEKNSVKIFQMIYKYLLSGKITYTAEDAQGEKVNRNKNSFIPSVSLITHVQTRKKSRKNHSICDHNVKSQQIK